MEETKLSYTTVHEIYCLIVNGAKYTGTALANTFNDFFVNLVNPNVDTTSVHSHYSSEITNPSESLYLSPTTKSEVMSTFLNLGNTKSVENTGMQIRPVRFVIDILSPVLTQIFNLVLQTGVIPRNMQIAQEMVLHKGGDINDLSNYRPISILPILSKGLEKIIHSRITAFLDKHSLHSDYQFRFRKKQSTELELLTQKEFIIKAFENKLYMLGIFIDLTKAFDHLNDAVLINKLSNFGIRGATASLSLTFNIVNNTYTVTLTSLTQLL